EGEVEVRERPALERDGVPRHAVLDPEEVAEPLDHVAVIAEGEPPGLTRLQPSAQSDPYQAGVLGLEDGGRLTALPMRRIDLELVEQLERDPWADGAPRRDIELRGRGEGDLADPALWQIHRHRIARDLGGVDALAGELHVPWAAPAGELGLHLAVLRPP